MDEILHIPQERETESLTARLRAKGVLLRDCANYPGLGPGWYRAAVRTEQENNAFLQAMKEASTGPTPPLPAAAALSARSTSWLWPPLWAWPLWSPPFTPPPMWWR